ncbi:copper resistance B [Salinisphaera hydrothermalis C27AD]
MTLYLSAVFATLAGVAGVVQAEELAGTAALNSVIPNGPTDSASGAPAAWSKPIHDKQINHYFSVDRLEYGAMGGPDNYLWDAQGWIGGDYNKFWWKTEGEGPMGGGAPDDTEFQALYSRMITPFWNAEIGMRYDVNPNPDRGFAVIGIQGLLPYWLESDTALFVSEDGDVSFRGEFEYELLLTQRLILQPRVEVNLSAQDAPEYGLASGLNNTEMGLRLRYQIRREFAPYIGVRWDQKYGATHDLARASGEDGSSTAFVIGMRAWY